MRYVMGLDGGGTKTVAVLADETGEIRAWGRGGPMNMSFVTAQVARQSVTDAIRGAFTEAGRSVPHVDLACVGSAGPVDMLEPSDVMPIHRWQVVYEHGLCMASAVEPGNGVVVLAGTGSFQWAKGDLKEHRVDGKGALFGDEGSAYWIARAALVAIGRAMDKRGPETRLTERVLAHLEVSNIAHLGRRLYGNGGMPRHEIAAIAPQVTKVALEGDSVAVEVCREAALLLAHGALVCIRESGLSGQFFPVVLCGGVMLGGGEVVVAPLERAVAAQEPGARFLFPKYEPAVGGVLSGLQHLGVPWTPKVLGKLDRSLEQRRKHST